MGLPDQFSMTFNIFCFDLWGNARDVAHVQRLSEQTPTIWCETMLKRYFRGHLFAHPNGER